uniref:Glycosyltransferase family 92 protein n=1 Tax=Parastrongyloides trichosuri TaxID=131310 RepID=A0A0N4Z211_PARTI
MVNTNVEYLLNVDAGIWQSVIEYFGRIADRTDNIKKITSAEDLNICRKNSLNKKTSYSFKTKEKKQTHLKCLKQVFIENKDVEKHYEGLYKYTKFLQINESINPWSFIKNINYLDVKLDKKLQGKKQKYCSYLFNCIQKINFNFTTTTPNNKKHLPNISSLLKTTKSVSKITKDMYKIYLKSAFLITNTTIRLTMVKSVEDDTMLFYRLPYKSKKFKNYYKINLRCQSGECIEKGLNFCTYVGYVGDITDNDIMLRESKEIYITKDILTLNDIKIPLIDSRPKLIIDNIIQYSHTLGICIQPMYLYYDYPTIIRFFENWIHEGATKFYIYYQSSLNKVKEIIDAYKKNNQIDIEIIDWSKFPFDEENDQYNPNGELYRLEVPLATYDCMQRARNNVKFVVSTDLDEIIHVNQGSYNGNLINLLEKESIGNPESAVFSFQSRRGYIKSNWGIGEPKYIDFSIYSNLVMDTNVFERPLYQKNIYRPERVISYQIHLIRSLEFNPLTGKKYSYTFLSPSSAFIFHLRRYKDYFTFSTTTSQSTILKEKSIQWGKNFYNNLEKLNFTSNGWLINIDKVGLELENCRKRVARTMGQIICQSVEVCENKMKEINSNNMIRANNSWIVI